MRFMMSLPAPVEALEKWDVAPNKEVVTAMRKFNADMAKAGVLLAAEGLHATSKGTRIRVSGGKRVVTDGPFTEAKELIAGFGSFRSSRRRRPSSGASGVLCRRAA
jgi:hypothetical protein